jgi:hypothetical protein
MQISKLSLTVCTAALCWSVVSLPAAQDTPAQAGARAALLKKMQEADGTAMQSSNMAPMAGMSMDTPKEPTLQSGDSPAQAAAKAAIMKRMQAETGQAAPAMAAVETKAQIKAEKQAAKAKADADAAQKLADQKAVQDQADLEASKAAAKAKAVKEAEARAAAVDYPGKELGFQVIQAPPLPISADKQVRLDALLNLYEANQISPEEYHRQRAAIVGQP